VIWVAIIVGIILVAIKVVSTIIFCFTLNEMEAGIERICKVLIQIRDKQ
jgi:hypothetical protein